MRSLPRNVSVLLLALVLPLTGCLFRSRPAAVLMSNAPLKEATLEDLTARINSYATKIQTLNATVDIDTSVGGSNKGKITDYQEIRGYILVRQPNMMRMIGLFPIVRNHAFDMVSDGSNFKLSIPAKNKFVVGSNDVGEPSKQPLENLRPQHIKDALLLKPVDPQNEIAVLESSTETVQDPRTKKDVFRLNYVVLVIAKGSRGWYLSRKVLFDRVDLQPTRQIIYTEYGWVATDAKYHDFRDRDGIAFPAQIDIWRPTEEYSITLNLLKVTLNQPLKDEQFVLEQPEGSQLVRLGASQSSAHEAH